MKFFTPLLDKVNKSVSNLLSVSNLEESYIAPSGTVNPNFRSNTSISSISSEIVGSLSPGFDISPPSKPNKSLEIYKSFNIEPLNSTFRELENSPNAPNLDEFDKLNVSKNKVNNLTIMLDDKNEKSNFSNNLNVPAKNSEENVTDKSENCKLSNEKSNFSKNLNVSTKKSEGNIVTDKSENFKLSNKISSNMNNEKSPSIAEKTKTGKKQKSTNDFESEKVEKNETENNEYFCKACQNYGCCQICRKIPCDNSIRCSAKSCQKWTHYECGNTNEEETESMRIYYCPPCKESNPLLKNIFYKNKSKSKKITQTKSKSEKLKKKKLKNSQKSKTKKLEKTCNLSDPKIEVSKTSISNETPPDREILGNLKLISPEKEKNSQLSSNSLLSNQAKSPNNSTFKNESSVKKPNESIELNPFKKMHVNEPETETLSVSKDEVSDKDTSLEISDDESFSQPLDVSEVMKKRNIEITGTELVKIFSSQLSDLHNEIFQLKHKIDELEKEKTKNKFTPNEKEKLKMFKAENETLRLENFELSETVNKLEKKLNLTTENMTRLVEKYKENDYDINKLEHLSTLQLKNKIKKQDQIIKSQEEDFCKVLETRDTFKTTLDRVNEENKKLSFKIKELTKNDINKKILNFAIEENEKLQSELILERERVIKFQTDNKNGEKFYNKKKDENANLRLEIGELQSIITSMSCSFENKNTHKVTLENNEWESCSEASVEITSEKKITQNPKSKEKIKNQDQTTNFPNSKTFFPSKNQKSKSQNDKVDQKKICYFYTQKRCKFGEKCFNLHPKDYLFNNFQNTQKINSPPFQSGE